MAWPGDAAAAVAGERWSAWCVRCSRTRTSGRSACSASRCTSPRAGGGCGCNPLPPRHHRAQAPQLSVSERFIIHSPQPVGARSHPRLVAMADRATLITLFGASGFTGQRVAAELCVRAPPAVTLVIAGRSEAKLQALKASVEGGDRLIVMAGVDIQDPTSLEAMAGRSRWGRGPTICCARCAAASTAACRPLQDRHVRRGPLPLLWRARGEGMR
jgi:hypothetical protein